MLKQLVPMLQLVTLIQEHLLILPDHNLEQLCELHQIHRVLKTTFNHVTLIHTRGLPRGIFASLEIILEIHRSTCVTLEIRRQISTNTSGTTWGWFSGKSSRISLGSTRCGFKSSKLTTTGSLLHTRISSFVIG